MSSRDESIDVRVRLKEARRFVSDTEGAAKAVDKVGAAGQRSSKRLDSTSRSAGRGRRALKHLGAAAIIAGAGLLSISAAKSAIDTTIGLAKAQSALHRNLGFTNREAGRWAAAIKVRGVDTSTLNLSFTNLAKNTVAAAGGSRKHRLALEREISALDERDRRNKDAITNLRAGNVLQLAHVSGNKAATAAIRSGSVVQLAQLRREGALIRARKTAASQQLKALQGNKAAIAAFKTLGISQAELTAAGRRGGFPAFLDRIADGLNRLPPGQKRTVLAQKLLGRSMQSTLPIFTKGSKAMHAQLNLADKYGAILTGKTAPSMQELITAQRELEFAQLGWKVTFATKIAPALTKLVLLGTKVSQWMAKHPTLVKVVIFGMLALAVAVWAVGAALSVIALGVGGAIAVGVILGLVAIGVGLVLLYKRFGKFRAVVDAVLGFVKKHWPLILGILTGPLGLAVIYIIRKWDTIVGFVKKLPGRLKAAGAGAWDWLKDSFRGVMNWVITKLRDFGWNKKKIRGAPDLPAFKPFGSIPLLATGGDIMPGGRAIVGEAGAELASFVNGKVEVTPLSESRGTGGGLKVRQPVILKLDNRVLGKAYVDFALDELAAT